MKGRRRELGSFLGGPVRPPEPAPEKVATNTDRVAARLQAEPTRWFSAKELEELTSVPSSHVNGAVYGLFKQGRVERLLPAEEGRLKRGQRYRWRTQR